MSVLAIESIRTAARLMKGQNVEGEATDALEDALGELIWQSEQAIGRDLDFEDLLRRGQDLAEEEPECLEAAVGDTHAGVGVVAVDVAGAD